jgi:hypothetical protein
MQMFRVFAVPPFVWAYYNSHSFIVIYFKLLATLAVEPLSLSITVVFANH